MGSYSTKVYIVQGADAQGNLQGPIIAAKLTFADAHQIAKTFAPAKVTCVVADKSPRPNGPAFEPPLL
jgi:hypothetical protein